jgi:hypothetical protein
MSRAFSWEKRGGAVTMNKIAARYCPKSERVGLMPFSF